MSEVQEQEEEQFSYSEIYRDDCHWFKNAITLNQCILLKWAAVGKRWNYQLPGRVYCIVASFK